MGLPSLPSLPSLPPSVYVAGVVAFAVAVFLVITKRWHGHFSMDGLVGGKRTTPRSRPVLAVKAIRQGVKVLERQSGVGHPVEEMEDEFRDWIIDFHDSGYVVRYRVDQRFVTVLAVRHQKEVGF